MQFTFSFQQANLQLRTTQELPANLSPKCSYPQTHAHRPTVSLYTSTSTVQDCTVHLWNKRGPGDTSDPTTFKFAAATTYPPIHPSPPTFIHPLIHSSTPSPRRYSSGLQLPAATALDCSCRRLVAANCRDLSSHPEHWYGHSTESTLPRLSSQPVTINALPCGMAVANLPLSLCRLTCDVCSSLELANKRGDVGSTDA
jgi:hypothetical protein